MDTVEFIQAIKISFTPGQPLAQQLANQITLAIRDQKITVGTKLPPIRPLATLLNLGKITVIGAYDRLVAQGFITSRRGSGFYVAGNITRVLEETPLPPIHKKIGGGLLRQLIAQRPDAVQLSEGGLPAEWFDDATAKNALRQLSRRSISYLGTNGTPAGYLPLREQIQRRLAELHIEAKTSQILVTHGASQALLICIYKLLEPQDIAFVDDPGFFKLHSLLRLHQINTIGITWQSDGPDIAQLEERLTIYRPKVFFTHSVLHNPSGGTLSSAKAYRLLQLAEKFNFTIVEIDVNADFQEIATVRLATLDQLQRVIYIGSFSKNMGIGLRTGYMACPPQIVADALNLRLILATTSPGLNERLIYQILTEGRYRSQITQLRNRLLTAGEHAQYQLENSGLEVFCPPLGGRFIWVRHPEYENSDLLAEMAVQHKIIIAPGSVFRPNNEITPYFRLNTTLANNPLLIEWLNTL